MSKSISKKEQIDNHLISKSIIENTSDFIIAFDNKGKTIAFNPVAQKLFGYSFKEAISKNEVDIFSGITTINKIKRAFDKKKTFNGLIKFRKKNNLNFINLSSAFTIKDDDANEVGYVVCGKDTKKLAEIAKKVANTEKIYKDLFENSTDLIQVIDLKGNLIHANKVWLKTFGYKEREINGLNIKKMLVHQENQYNKRGFIDEVLNSGRNKIKIIVCKDKKGNECILEGNSIVDYNKGKPISIRSIFRNITEIRKAEQKLRINSSRLHAVFNNSTHLFWIVNNRICLTAFNKNFAESIKNRYGIYPELNLDYGKEKNFFSDEKTHQLWNEKYKLAFQGKVVNFETKSTDLQGNTQYRETFLNPIILPNGDIKEVSGIAHDITEKKIAEKKLKEQTAKINSIFDSASNMVIFSFDKNFRIKSFNKNFSKYLLLKHGIPVQIDAVIDFRLQPALQGSKEVIGTAIEKAFKGINSQIIISIIDLNGNKEWFEVFYNPVYIEHNKISEVSCIAFEITKRKETEDKLRAIIKDKEILLKEVHHRVKNNLQVISSILSLQASYVKDKKTLDILNESQDRIKTMSFVHESLYQNTDLSSIQLGDYILTLAQNLVYTYKLSNSYIKLETHFDTIYLDIDQSIPCGLIVNELVSNALKHAYKNIPKGILKINIKKKGNKILLVIADNGSGMAENMHIGTTDTLGFQLVHALVNQLDGTITVNTKKGTEYLITFEQAKAL